MWVFGWLIMNFVDNLEYFYWVALIWFIFKLILVDEVVVLCFIMWVVNFLLVDIFIGIICCY